MSKGPWWLLSFFVVSAELACGEQVGVELPTLDLPALDRRMRWEGVSTGWFFEATIDEIVAVERRFAMYEREGSLEPAFFLPEVNTLAGQAGPQFYLGNERPNGTGPIFSGSLWLEIQTRLPGELAYVPMSPRVLLDSDESAFGHSHPTQFRAGTLQAIFPVRSSLLPSMFGRKFDGARWGSVDHSRWGGRIDMIGSLLNQHEFLGMKRYDLELLLGVPTNGAGEWDLAYRLGLRWMDHIWLEFKMNDDAVAMMRLYED